MNNFRVYFLINRGNLAFYARMIFLATEKKERLRKQSRDRETRREAWLEMRPGVFRFAVELFRFERLRRRAPVIE